MPVADATAAVSAFAVLAIVLLVIGGLIYLGRRQVRRGQEEIAEAEAAGLYGDDSDDEAGDDMEPNLGGLGLAITGAALAIVAVFLPALEASEFSGIEKNSMIQSGSGWLVLGCAVGIIGAAYRIYSRRIKSWSVFVLGLVILGAAVYDGTGDRTKLESVLSFAGESVVVDGSPAVGLYAAGAAGGLAMFAGLVLAGHVFSSYEGVQRKTKTCPDCAETVLAAARVCKHCGHEFAQLQEKTEQT